MLGIIETWWLDRALPVMATSVLVLLSGCASGADALAHVSTGVGRASDSPLSEKAEPKSYRYRLTSASNDEEITRGASTPAPLVLRGRGTAGKIVDRQGEIVLDAAKSGSIYGLDLSPGRDKALVYFGDANYTVIDTETLEEEADPPARPPVYQDATGFSWWFLDDGRLIGQADLPSTDTAGKTAADIESLLPRGTLIYVYVLESGALVPVVIDDTLPHIFSIFDVYDGNITLLTYDDERIGATIVRASER
ncbi:hypothetical protein [Luteimonas sp. R10]|uniref:hypothetical protein n=1 Tax=Luteimonas sp. R10 TaxID=3108176 RepID=UPI003089B0FE|nr:hypothetical protein U3649_15080 [Luteimonas sp. R10]